MIKFWINIILVLFVGKSRCMCDVWICYILGVLWYKLKKVFFDFLKGEIKVKDWFFYGY